MSGTLHFYRIDQSKTKTVLYKILTDKNIEPRFNIKMMYYYKNPKNQDVINKTSISKENGWVKGFYEYMMWEKQEAVYNTIIQKVKEDFNELTHGEFENLMGWCLKYFVDENGDYQWNEEEKLGLYEIEELFSRDENLIFHRTAAKCIEEYYYKLKKGNIDSFWTSLSAPFNYQEFNLALDFLILVCLKIKSKRELLVSKENQLISDLKLNSNYVLLDKCANDFLENVSMDITKDKFDKQLEVYLIDYYSSLLYKFSKMKEGVQGYKGNIFRLDCF